MNRMLLITASMCIVLFSSFSWAATIRVPQDQPTIQAGIDAAVNGDTVLVGDGNWSGPGNRDLRFHGKEIVVRSVNGPLECIIDCQELGRGFYLADGEGDGAAIIGFQIFRGKAILGGGILLSGEVRATVSGNWFIECAATEGGGGLCCEHQCQARVIGNSFFHCTVTGYGGAIECYQASPTIGGNRIYENYADQGGGIASRGGTGFPYIQGNRIHGNHAQGYGGGIHCTSLSAPVLFYNEIKGNRAEEGGGGIYFYQVPAFPPVLFFNEIDSNVTPTKGGGVLLEDGASVFLSGGSMSENSSSSGGGGIYIGEDCSANVSDILLAGNTSDSDGGGITVFHADTVTLSGVSIVDNEAYGYGGGLYINDTVVEAEDSIIWGNYASASENVYITPFVYYFVPTYCDIQGGWIGDGVIDQNPLFVSGPQDDYYLSETGAGQTSDSPCIDSGNPLNSGIGTTRTDCVTDGGVVDMGHHRRVRYLVAGPGRGYENPPLVRVLPPAQNAQEISDFWAYGVPHYGVNVAVGSVDYPGQDHIITGPGPGAIYGPHVRGFEIDGTTLPGLSFFAYGTQKFGVNVTTGNLDGSGTDEIITGAGPGAVFGPHVRAFTYADGVVTPLPEVSFFSYGTLKYGVNVTAGDIDGDRQDEIVTGAGPGAVFGPHVRGWNVDGGTVSPMSGVNFLAYGTNRYGVNVGCGDIDGDGIDEIITGPGPSGLFGAQIRGWNYDGVFLDDIPGCNFFAWTPDQAMYGARVSASDLDYNGRAEIIVGAGPDPAVDSTIKVFSFDEDELTQQFTLRIFPANWKEGANAVGGMM